MPTYFNYVEREADSYVNWADVGRDMSNTIDDIQRVREEKKALIEKTYREDLKFIQDNPSGEHESLRAWSLDVSQSSAEMMRLQNTMLKQGKLSLPNYLTFRQNITDSVEKIYTVNSQLQEAFKEVNDRTKAGDNQQLERETKVLLEKYGKLQDTEAYINPLNGTIYLGLTEIVEDDGKSVRRLKKGDGTYLSPDQLQAAAVQKFDKFDERPALKIFVDGLGDVNEQIRQIGGEALAGKILSITDVTYDRIIEIADSLPEGQKLTPAQMEQLKKYAKDFNEAETKYIDGILKNPFDASSLLTENIRGKDGKVYNIVFNKADQKTEYDIYVDKTDSKFTPVFDESTEIGKKQKEVLTNYLRGQLRVMYDRKVEQASIAEPRKERPPVVQPTAAQSERLAGIEDVQGSARWIGQLYSGNNKVKQNALEILRQEQGVLSARFIEMEGGVPGLEIINAKGTSRIKITPDLTVAQFGKAVASAIYADTENRKVLNRYEKQFDDSITAQHSTYTPMDMSDKPDQYWTAVKVEKENPYALFVKENEKSKENPQGFWEQSFLDLPADKVASKLNANLPKYGKFRARNTSGVYSEVTIEKLDANGKVISSETIQPNWNGKNEKARNAQMKRLESFLQDNIQGNEAP